MWDQLTPMDLQRARDRLAALRTVTLNRHVEEVKRLDIEQAEIEALERLAASFAQRYMNSAAAPQPTTESQPAVAVVADKDTSEPARSEVPWASPSPDLPVHHHASPNFGTPPRLRRFVQ
jgi:hypothetical protein